MGLYIAEMDMPENCYKCPVRNQGFSGDGMKCGKTGSVLSWYDGNRKRMDNCPLLFVPPHGRLGDLGALILEIKEYIEEYNELDENGYHNLKWCAMKEAEAKIENAPTIIPAEEDEA